MRVSRRGGQSNYDSYRLCLGRPWHCTRGDQRPKRRREGLLAKSSIHTAIYICNIHRNVLSKEHIQLRFCSKWSSEEMYERM